MWLDYFDLVTQDRGQRFDRLRHEIAQGEEIFRGIIV